MNTVKKNCFVLVAAAAGCIAIWASAAAAPIGQEKAIPRHLADGEEFSLPLQALLQYGQRFFSANWTIQDGGGRPLTKGT